MKKIRKILLLMGCVVFLHSLNVAASDWFVRPAGGNYGNEDGSSYQNAWDGLLNVVWGPGGVEAGDTLYICGLHLRTRTGYPAWERFTPGANGTGEDSRIIIRGDYPGDQGIIWGAGIMAHEDWVDEGNNVWSITDVGVPVGGWGGWYFEDITSSSWTVLTGVGSLAEVQATPGSYYGTYTGGEKFYVHASDNGDPTGRIAANRLGYYPLLRDNHYITWLNLKAYSIYRWIELSGAYGDHATYVKWDGCTLWYGERYMFLIRNFNHHLEFIDCDIAWTTNGIWFQEVPRPAAAAEDAPHHMTVSGCTFHDIGVTYADSDSHAIGEQGMSDGLIERNEMYNVGSGITFYEMFTQTQCKNNTIRWNYIHDTHTNGGANSRGIEFNMSGGNTCDKSGNTCYGNIVSRVDGVGYRSTWPVYEITFYNNVAYDCGTSFYFYNTAQDDVGPNMKLRNNISVDPTNYHIYFVSDESAGEYVIDSDYNLFDPVVGDVFYFRDDVESGTITYTEWKALSKAGCTFDTNSKSGAPLFLSEGSNFKVNSGSPAIDAGINVGLTQDFEGNPVPQGNAPDIGAYEYIVKSDDPQPEPKPDPDPDPPIEPEDTLPDKTELKCFNNIFNPIKGNKVIIKAALREQAELKLTVYNSKGKKIIILAEENKAPGFHTYTWDGKDDSGNTVGSGIYIIHMKTGNFEDTKKIVVVK